MLPTFANLLGAVDGIPGVMVRISVYYTRVDARSALEPVGGGGDVSEKVPPVPRFDFDQKLTNSSVAALNPQPSLSLVAR